MRLYTFDPEPIEKPSLLNPDPHFVDHIDLKSFYLRGIPNNQSLAKPGMIAKLNHQNVVKRGIPVVDNETRTVLLLEESGDFQDSRALVFFRMGLLNLEIQVLSGFVEAIDVHSKDFKVEYFPGKSNRRYRSIFDPVHMILITSGSELIVHYFQGDDLIPKFSGLLKNRDGVVTHSEPRPEVQNYRIL